MTAADDNVTPLPTSLERVGRRIDNAWRRIGAGEHEWIEGSLELAQALDEGRKLFQANQAFGQWLVENNHDHVNKDDRAALIGLASDLVLAREVLTQTDRRSYQHIWAEVKSRFLHVKKTDKPMRGRPGEPRNAKTTKRAKRHESRPAEHHAAAAKCLDEGKSRVEVAAETGLSEHQVQLTREREIGRREMLAELLDAAAAANFSDKGKLRIEDAIRIHKAYLDRQFEQRVNEEVRRRIDAADDATRKQAKELHLQNLNLQRIVGQRAVFTETQYRQMLMLCHPDNSASQELRGELLQILKENKIKLAKSE